MGLSPHLLTNSILCMSNLYIQEISISNHTYILWCVGLIPTSRQSKDICYLVKFKSYTASFDRCVGLIPTSLEVWNVWMCWADPRIALTYVVYKNVDVFGLIPASLIHVILFMYYILATFEMCWVHPHIDWYSSAHTLASVTLQSDIAALSSRSLRHYNRLLNNSFIRSSRSLRHYTAPQTTTVETGK